MGPKCSGNAAKGMEPNAAETMIAGSPDSAKERTTYGPPQAVTVISVLIPLIRLFRATPSATF